jgi:hypothetical protein
MTEIRRRFDHDFREGAASLARRTCMLHVKDMPPLVAAVSARSPVSSAVKP